LILVIGDLFIPHRAHDIPAEFKKMFLPGKIEKVFLTGNLCSKEVVDFFRTLTSDVHVVAGEFDEPKKYQETDVVTVGDFKIGLCHGHQVIPWGDKEALAILQRQLDVDVLITGHTHEFKAYEHNNKFFLNPGSGTGAYSGLNPDVKPSFVLMDVRDSAIGMWVYQLPDGPEGQVKVTKMFHKKKV